MRVIALALSLLAVVPGATPLAPGAPRFAQLAEVQGMPADSASRYAFLDGLRGMFAEDVLETEDADGGQPDRVPNRFRLLEGDEAQDAWRIGLVLGAPPVLRPAGKVTSRGSAPRVELRRAGRGVGLAGVRRQGLADVGEARAPGEGVEGRGKIVPPAKVLELRRTFPQLLALVHESPATRPVAHRLVARLREIPLGLAHGRATDIVVRSFDGVLEFDDLFLKEQVPVAIPI